MRVLIIGGGVMGCASALALSARGVDVELLERAVPGAEASSAAAGILGAQLEAREHPQQFDLFVRARDGYGAWASDLKERTGIDVGYRATGGLRLASTDQDLEAAAREVAWHTAQRARATLLDARAVHALEPTLRRDARGGAFFPDDAQVDPPRLLRALVAATAHPRAGEGRITTRAGTTVQRLLVDDDDSACRGVVLEGGEALHGDATVLAAGSWSSLLPGVPSSLPRVRPARGQLVMLEERPPQLRHIVFGEGAYLVPRGDGRVLCGSTVEFVGFRREVTAGGVHAVLSSALAMVPSLAEAPLVSSWSSFRPHAEGGAAPLVGASPLPGLFLATGHYRNGILLAKVTADEVTAAVLESAR